MTRFFTRLKLAFKAFFSILFRGRIPADVLALSPSTPDSGEAAPASLPVEATAIQILAVLQRDGRLVDFLMEDVASYPDAQIGAAVRDVHAGCRRALQQYLTLAPVLEGEEGRPVTVEAGTDAATVKVVGNVAGQPPFRGVLLHRGWLVRRLALPPLPATGRMVIAPAEVEVL